MNVFGLVAGLALVAAGALILVASRRRSLLRISRGEEPGKNLAGGIAAGLLGVGLLAVARSFFN